MLCVGEWARGNGSWNYVNYVEFTVGFFSVVLLGCGIFGSVHMCGNLRGEVYREKRQKSVAISRYSSPDEFGSDGHRTRTELDGFHSRLIRFKICA